MIKYTYVPEAEVTQEMVDDCLNTDLTHLRITTDEYCLLKYNEPKPASLSSYENIYHEDEILQDIWRNPSRWVG